MLNGRRVNMTNPKKLTVAEHIFCAYHDGFRQGEQSSGSVTNIELHKESKAYVYERLNLNQEKKNND